MDFLWDAIQAGFGFGLGLIWAGLFAGVFISIVVVIIGGLQRRHG